MRYTLEQLEAMSDWELEQHWKKALFPFDGAICRGCLLQHQDFTVSGCTHKELKKTMDALPQIYAIGEYLRPHLEELYALRLFYDSLYPQESPSPTEAIAESEARIEVGEKP